MQMMRMNKGRKGVKEMNHTKSRRWRDGVQGLRATNDLAWRRTA